MTKELVIANLPEEQRQKIRKSVKEISDSLQRIADEREFIKSVLETTEELGVDKKIIRKAAKTLFKGSYAQEKDENAYFEEVFDNVILKV